MSDARYGSYRPVRRIGKGGMGEVWEAEHVLIGKRAAIKTLRRDLSSDRELVQRFFNEARATTQIHHPGIVEVFDFGFTDDGAGYLVMEYLDGESLGARLRRARPLPTALAITIARQIAGAVGAAHRKGVVHRDLKPDNVFLVPHPEMASGFLVKVLDFGIAKLQREDGQDAAVLTRTGAVIGTPLYMAPEQCRGISQIDHRADVYALGCILHEMVIGEVPFTGEGTGDVIAAHIHQPLPDPRLRAPQLAQPLAALLRAMLAKKPDQRPATMEQVAEALASDDLAAQPSGPPTPISRDTAPDAVLPTILPDEAVSPTLPSARRDPTPVMPVVTPPPYVDTTLRSAAAESVARPPSRRLVAIGGAIALGAAATAGGVYFLRDRSTAPAGTRRLTVLTRASARFPTLGDQVTLHFKDGARNGQVRLAGPVAVGAPLSLIVLVEGTERFLGNDSYEASPERSIDGGHDGVRRMLETIGELVPSDAQAQLVVYGAQIVDHSDGFGPPDELVDSFGVQQKYQGEILADLSGGAVRALATLQGRAGDRVLLVVGGGDNLRGDDPLVAARRQAQEMAVSVLAIAGAWSEELGSQPQGMKRLTTEVVQLADPGGLSEAFMRLWTAQPRSWRLEFDLPARITGEQNFELWIGQEEHLGFRIDPAVTDRVVADPLAI